MLLENGCFTLQSMGHTNHKFLIHGMFKHLREEGAEEEGGRRGLSGVGKGGKRETRN